MKLSSIKSLYVFIVISLLAACSSGVLEPGSECTAVSGCSENNGGGDNTGQNIGDSTGQEGAGDVVQEAPPPEYTTFEFKAAMQKDRKIFVLNVGQACDAKELPEFIRVSSSGSESMIEPQLSSYIGECYYSLSLTNIREDIELKIKVKSENITNFDLTTDTHLSKVTLDQLSNLRNLTAFSLAYLPQDQKLSNILNWDHLAKLTQLNHLYLQGIFDEFKPNAFVPFPKLQYLQIFDTGDIAQFASISIPQEWLKGMKNLTLLTIQTGNRTQSLPEDLLNYSPMVKTFYLGNYLSTATLDSALSKLADNAVSNQIASGDFRLYQYNNLKPSAASDASVQKLKNLGWTVAF